MDSRFVRRLHAELPVWTHNGWITPAQAGILAEHYPLSAQQGREWWQVLLSILAALCVGAGIIALFAANWHELSRSMRAALSIAPLLLGQAAFLFAFFRRFDSIAWRESSAIFIAVATGAAIALIAQTYHIESTGRFLHLWLWLTIPLVYLTQSWAAAFFVLFLVQALGVTEMRFFSSNPWTDSWEYFGYSLALIPWLMLNWRRGAAYAGQRAIWRSFASCMTMATVFILLLHAEMEMACLWLLVGSSYLAVSTLQEAGYNLMQRVGMVVLGGTMLAMGENDFFWQGTTRFMENPVLVIVSTAASLFALARWRNLHAWDVAFVLGGVALIGFNIAINIPAMQPWLGTPTIIALQPWIVTFAIVALGLWQLHRSLHSGDLVAINAALIWVLSALYLRFIEESMPLWIKGIVFIAAGVALYTLNMMAARQRRHLRTALKGESA